jgi:hypothetical protein
MQSTQTECTTVDTVQSPYGGFLIMVCGKIKIDHEENPIRFSQVFLLVNAGAASNPPTNDNYLIFNDVFRLNYG